jgi:hypothetical protein
MISTLLALMFLTLSPVCAKTSLVDVEWRKIELEKVLTERIKNLLFDESFKGIHSVDVQIELDKSKYKKEMKVEEGDPALNSDIPKTDLTVTPIAKFDLQSEVIAFRQDKGRGEREFDIFKYFKNINVLIYFEPNLTMEKQQLVMDFMAKNFPVYSGVQIIYTPKTAISIAEPPVAPDFWSSRRQDYVLYLILSILGIMALLKASQVMYRGFTSLADSLSKAQEPSASASASYDQAKEDKEKAEEVLKSSGPAATKISFDKHEGVKKYKVLLSQSPKEAVSVLKQWLKDQSLDARSALYMVLRSLDVNELQQLFQMIPPRERMKLKSSINISYQTVDSNRGDSFIQDQISTLILYRDKIEDERLKELIADADEKKLISLISQNYLAGAYLLGMLPPFQSSKISDSIPEEVFIQLMSVPVDEDVPMEVTDYIVNYLENNKVKFNKLPVFLENLEEFLGNASAQREETIFKLSLDFFDQEEILGMVVNYCPVFILKNLSGQALYRVVQKMGAQDKIRFLVCLEDQIRNDILNEVGEPMSRAREVYEVDLEKILINEELVTKVKNDAPRIWYTFKQAARKIIQKDEAFRRLTLEIGSRWITDNSSADNRSKSFAA